MSRRKITIKTDNRRPREHKVFHKPIHDIHIQEQRRIANAADDEEMKRLIGNGSVELSRRFDAKYISQMAHDYGWNQTRFKKAMERVVK